MTPRQALGLALLAGQDEEGAYIAGPTPIAFWESPTGPRAGDELEFADAIIESLPAGWDVRPALDLDKEEEEVMMLVLGVYERIVDWGLGANQYELAGAIHVIQGFIVQHMLHRVAPKAWQDWFTHR